MDSIIGMIELLKKNAWKCCLTFSCIFYWLCVTYIIEPIFIKIKGRLYSYYIVNHGPSSKKFVCCKLEVLRVMVLLVAINLILFNFA